MSIAEKLTKLAENEEKVYKAGEKAEYDRFWDNYQDNGNRTNYNYAFAGGWDESVFKPKYPVKIVGAGEGEFHKSQFTNLKQHCIDNGIVIDTSGMTTSTNLFRQCFVLTYVPFLDFSNATSVVQTFYQCTNLIEVDDIDCSNSTNCNRMFYGCDKLKKIKSFRVSEKCTNFENTFIPRNIEEIDMQGTVSADISFKNATLLNKKSIESIINVLSTTITGKTAEFSKTAKENAFTDEEWASLIATKPNWTISLA